MDCLFTKDKLAGLQIHFPGDHQYQLSVATANLLYRYMTPICVVLATHTSHIQATVQLARKLNVHITVKNGGHSFPGFSNSEDDGILLDMTGFRKVGIVNEREDGMLVTVQAGALWGDAYKLLIERCLYEYIVVGGRCPTVGITGYTLGGGLSPFSRSLGMTIDNIHEMTVVTPEGEVVTVGEKNDPGSREGLLFWGLRGGGGGNFGIVTEIKHKVHRLSDSRGRIVSGKFVQIPGPDEQSISKFVNEVLAEEFYRVDWANETTIDTVWDCHLNKPNAPLEVTFNTYYNGNMDTFKREIDTKLPETSVLKKEFISKSREEISTLFLHETLDAQWKHERRRFCPQTKSYGLNSSFVYSKANPEDLVSAVKALGELTLDFRRLNLTGPDCLFEVKLIHGGGAASDVPTDQTAYPWRNGLVFCHILVQWTDKYLEGDMQQFFDACKTRLIEYAIEKRAVFVSFGDRYLVGWQHKYYGNHYEKLQKVKKIWDPQDFCKFKQSIELPGSEAVEEEHANQVQLRQSEIEEQWSRYHVPERRFGELKEAAGHSCANCS